MLKQKQKKGFKKIIVSLLIAFFMATTVATLFTSNEIGIGRTAYAGAIIPLASSTAQTPAAAQLTCGDGVVDKPTEQCDDGNTLSGDGCSDTCQNDQLISAFGKSGTDINGFISVVFAIQDMLNRLLWPILLMIGGLMDNSLLFGAGMEEKMREIWIPIRNLINILFVIAMVGIALYNVLGIGEEGSNASLKSALPKLILGIIAVNFSFLGIKVFLDFVNVMTVSIFSLPDQVGEGTAVIEVTKDPKVIESMCKSLKGQDTSRITEEEFKIESKSVLYEKIAADLKLSHPSTSVTRESLIKSAVDAKFDGVQLSALDDTLLAYENGEFCDGFKLTETGRIFMEKYRTNNAAFALALNMGKIVFYSKLDPSAKSMDKLVVSAIFSAVLYVVYAVSFVALFVVLLGRLVVLWLCIVLSPVLLLSIAVPALGDKLEMFESIKKQFVKNAIAPIIIALAMTIGWIMLKAMQSVNGLGGSDILSPGSEIIFGSTGTGFPIVGLNTLQDVIVALGTIAVVWMGVFGAAEGTVAEKFTGMIKENVEGFGKWLGALPIKHLPAIPIKLPDGTDYNASAAEVLYAGKQIISKGQYPDTLAKKLGLGSAVTIDNLNAEITTGEGALGILLAPAVRDALGTIVTRDKIKKWAYDNPTAATQARDRVGTAVWDKYLKSTEENLPVTAKALIKAAEGIGIAPASGGSTAGGNTAASGASAITTPAAPQLPVGAIIKVKDANGANQDVAITDVIDINTSLTALNNADFNKPYDIETKVKTLNTDIWAKTDNKPMTVEDFKSDILKGNDPLYNKITTALADPNISGVYKENPDFESKKLQNGNDEGAAVLYMILRNAPPVSQQPPAP